MGVLCLAKENNKPCHYFYIQEYSQVGAIDFDKVIKGSFIFLKLDHLIPHNLCSQGLIG